MILERPSYENIQAILDDIHPDCLREMQAYLWGDDIRECHITIKPYLEAGFVACADDRTPIAFIGGYPTRRQVWNVWAFFSVRFAEIVRPFSKFMLDEYMVRAFQCGCRRVEARVLSENKNGLRWMGIIGGEVEAVCPHYGNNGEEFTSIVWHPGTKGGQKFIQRMERKGKLTCLPDQDTGDETVRAA